MKRKVKVLPILVALVTSTGGVNLVLGEGISGSAVFNQQSNSSDEIVPLVYDSPETIPVTIKETTIFTTGHTTSTTTATTTTTVATTESIYKDIMFLNNSDYSMDDINGMIIKYSGYCNIDYDTAISILKDNYDYVCNFSSIEEGIMRTLFDKCSELGYLSCYCSNDCKVTKTLDRDQMEAIMLDICRVMGISDDDEKIVLSIFRWETGHGTSSLCVNSNNYGGIRVYNGEFGIYQTPEYGMYKAIECMYGHICRARNNGCTDTYSIIYYMSSAYCPGTASSWADSISGMTYSVSNYYDFDSGYVKKYEN